jgi:hypothetical protein
MSHEAPMVNVVEHFQFDRWVYWYADTSLHEALEALARCKRCWPSYTRMRVMDAKTFHKHYFFDHVYTKGKW